MRRFRGESVEISGGDAEGREETYGCMRGHEGWWEEEDGGAVEKMRR